MPTIALPIETKSREFLGKLWLGLNLVQRGHTVVLGPSYEVKKSLDRSKPDIYITKDPGDSQVQFFSTLSDAGIVVCGLDTEGGVFDSIENYTNNKQEVLEYLDCLFVWGEKPANALAEAVGKSETIVVTGNPRFDLLAPGLRNIYADEALTLIDRYGEYVLFNTSFGAANHLLQDAYESGSTSLGAFDIDFYKRKSHLLYATVEAIHALSEVHFETSIIIRPHPSEDSSTYEKIFRHFENVYVEQTGDVRSWIFGAQVVVHSGSTTGIEGAMMDRPVLSFWPLPEETNASSLPNRVSEVAFDRQALLQKISAHLGSDSDYELSDKQRAYLKQYIHNVDEYSSDLICDWIDSIEFPDRANYRSLTPGFKERIEQRVKRSRWSGLAETMYDLAVTLRSGHDGGMKRAYGTQKFPGLTKSELVESVRRFQAIVEVDGVRLEKVPRTRDTFELFHE